MPRFTLTSVTAESTAGGRRDKVRRNPRADPRGRVARGSSGEWTNWARTVTATPLREAAPESTDELSQLVRDAADSGLHVRAIGAGHSFTAAAVTDGLMLRLENLDRVERGEPLEDGCAQVTVGAGIRLYDLNRALAGLGLALGNLGDIDQQSISGAISTGTHGTGVRLTGLAGMVVGVRVVLPSGQVVEADRTREPALFEAARLGLGVVGILAAVTLKCVP